MARSRSKAVAAQGNGPDLSGWARRPGDRQFVEALARGLEVLRAFKPNDGVLGNLEISERTNLPRPTVTRLTYTLTKLGYLTYLERLGRYKLAPGALSIGYAAMANFRIREVARPLMQAMADEAKASVALGGPDRLSMVYISHLRSSSRVGVRLEVGSRIPMATSAMGRAYLAALPDAERAPICELIEARSGEDWPRVRDGIERGREQIARWGFTISVGEWQDDINGVGVPFVPQDGSGVLAFNCGAPAFMLAPARLQHEIGPHMVDMVRSVETRLAGGDDDFGVRRYKNPVFAGGDLGGEREDGERKGQRPKTAGRRERPNGS
ncbi:MULTISPECIES: IclR family transcriptional regulator [Rhodomicrobium]|uniref:IclR family transcriptional regulator n=1 Tax=Rhodomicrobium TaxID=1068 RepID=UPI001AEC761F|nr:MULTISPECIES: IclR family transcriptional regulator [Rhodomicrobium]